MSDSTVTATVRPVPTGAPPQSPAAETPTPIALTTPADVERWLRTMPGDAICGRPHAAGDCPLARYLTARNGHPDWSIAVSPDGYHVGGQSYPMPWWARRFVQGVDALPQRLGRPAEHGVTAAEALHVLEGVRRLEEARMSTAVLPAPPTTTTISDCGRQRWDMRTDFISAWSIASTVDPDTPLTFETFGTLAAAQEWTKECGYIGGIYYSETRTPATFIVTSDDARQYLGCGARGARGVQTVYVYDIPALVIGVPVEHTLYFCQRLRAGRIRYAGPFDSLEAAREQARLGL